MFSCCKCVKSFEKSGDLWNHLKIHNINTKTRTKLVCHVQECFKTFYHGYSYKRHLQYHDSIAQNVSDEDSHGNAVSDDESVSDQSEVLPNEKPNEEISANIKHSVSEYVAKLKSSSLPSSTVQSIICDTRELLRNVNEAVLQVSAPVLEDIAHDIKPSDDKIDSLQSVLHMVKDPFDYFSLSTVHKQNQYAHECKVLIEPEEIVLGKAYRECLNVRTGRTEQKQVDETFQYVPIGDSLKVLLEQPGYMSVISQEKDSAGEKEVLQTYRDGSYYSTFEGKQNCLDIELLLYNDDFETANPLGSKKGKHKLLGVYLTVASLPKKYQAKLENVLLVALAKSSLVSKYGVNAVLQRISDDLEVLFTEGLHIDSPDGFNGTIRLRLLQAVGDNLALNTILGFAGSFSANYYCRFCKALKAICRKQDKANDSAESVLTGMQMGWESPELSDDFMISDVESVPFDLSQASTIAVDEDSCSSVVNDLNSSSDTPPLKRQKAVRYDVGEILKKTMEGRKTLEEVTRMKVCAPHNTRVVCNLCTEHLVNLHGLRPGPDMKGAMASSIIAEFPFLKDPAGNGDEEWYFKSSKCPAGGRIENRLKYLRRITAEKDKKQVGVGSPEDIASTSSSEDLASPQMNYDLADMKVITEWLKSHNTPQKDVVAKMQLTSAYRKDFVHSTLPGSSRKKPCVAEVLDEFPHLLSPGMIEQDYEMLFSGRGKHLYTKWPVVSACILEYANRVSPGWKARFNVQHRKDTDFCQDERMNLAFCLLSHLFPGKKSTKGGRASIQEALDNFIDFQKEGTNVEAYKSSHGRNQPFILALGGHFCNPAQTFVVLEHHVLEQKSLVAAVDLCYKIFQIFDLQYPCQARAMWVVMDTIAFDVKPGAQESGAVRAFRAYYHFNQK
ncbi:uncharacterized protein LOC115926207 isoform X1 [Strongylocentrotus purpuratus]|uniref:C2H2-type domain-containing protein n=2 Tax=Strongylocentrotus purpuratus TaxID=7668 RepID=A0A7M7P5R8_STRPU|nr:uncharacterized protein LOC115926207 isoform X1 [Strongylocentrotus purpuratus]